MQITIVGAGVMGRLWAARLAADERDVRLFDTSHEVVADLNQRGITIEERDGATRTVEVRAVTAVDGLGPQDIVFFFVKSGQTNAAAHAVRGLVGANTALVSLQNGFGHGDTLSGIYPPAQVVIGTTYQGGGLIENEKVFHAHDGHTILGPYADGGDLRFAQLASDVLNAGGIESKASREARKAIWEKLTFSAAVFPVKALTGLCYGADIADRSILPVVKAIVEESVTEANARGYAFNAEEELTRILTRLDAVGYAKPSMLQDLEAHRETEVDFITGEIVKMARSRGMDAPASATVTALIHGRELSWQLEAEHHAGTALPSRDAR